MVRLTLGHAITTPHPLPHWWKVSSRRAHARYCRHKQTLHMQHRGAAGLPRRFNCNFRRRMPSVLCCMARQRMSRELVYWISTAKPTKSSSAKTHGFAEFAETECFAPPLHFRAPDAQTSQPSIPPQTMKCFGAHHARKRTPTGPESDPAAV